MRGKHKFSLWTKGLFNFHDEMSISISGKGISRITVHLINGLMKKIIEEEKIIILSGIEQQQRMGRHHRYVLKYKVDSLSNLKNIIAKIPIYTSLDVNSVSSDNINIVITTNTEGRKIPLYYNRSFGLYRQDSYYDIKESLNEGAATKISLWTRSLFSLETQIKINIPINPQYVKSRNKIFLNFMEHLRKAGYEPIIVGSEHWQGELKGKSTYSHLSLLGYVDLDKILQCFPILPEISPAREKFRREVIFIVPKNPGKWNDTEWGIIYLYQNELWRKPTGEETRSDKYI